MMKFLAAFCTSMAFLLGASSFVTPIKPHAEPLVPARIVDTKKIEPIKVPYIGCIINVEGEAGITLEEGMRSCMTKREWLDINIDEDHTPI
jgi:hypothetical protein